MEKSIERFSSESDIEVRKNKKSRFQKQAAKRMVTSPSEDTPKIGIGFHTIADIPDGLGKRAQAKDDGGYDDYTPSSRVTKKEDQTRKSGAQTQIDEDYIDYSVVNTLEFAKNLLKNSDKSMSAKIMFTPHDIRNNYFLHEVNLLAKIMRIVTRDLMGVRNYLNGKMIENIKAKYLSTLTALHNNKVPFHWMKEFTDLNIIFTDYTSFIKSFLRKADSIYGTINNLNLNLPPVIPIGHI